MNSQRGRLIGAVDIGGTKIAVGIVDDDGKVLASDECPTEQERGFGSGVDRMVRMLKDCATRAGVNLTGIGIGCTGPVYPRTGKIGDVAFLKSWKDANLVEALESRFGVSAALENDADAATLGEAVGAPAAAKRRCCSLPSGPASAWAWC